MLKTLQWARLIKISGKIHCELQRWKLNPSDFVCSEVSKAADEQALLGSLMLCQADYRKCNECEKRWHMSFGVDKFNVTNLEKNLT